MKRKRKRELNYDALLEDFGHLVEQNRQLNMQLEHSIEQCKDLIKISDELVYENMKLEEENHKFKILLSNLSNAFLYN